ncbi:heparinase II/III family protein [Paenibacillus doosanensis]|uniref:Heparinase II/III-like protein n=1 Tax=Paenibacillus konkukensis TaxID=2020716 RepID=A0ABY4RGM9_9BACL|nr:MULTISPECIES: heparinase II/III family protein [Paenibacillus]MCS7460594.1 heparinase II/III family protein [Paenibacillus doosanensis]UQZ81185.1 Heparinase II/III-like protein [Paenibacillus konkukensis]
MTGIEQLTLRQLKSALERAQDEGAPLFPEAADPRSWRRSRQDPRCAQVWNDIRTAGESFLSAAAPPLPYSAFTLFHRTGDRTRYDDSYFDRRRRLCVLAMLAIADEEGERWIAPLQDIIWAICDEYTWVIPAHVGLYHNDYPSGIWDRPEPPRETVDLFAGETAFALAEITGLLEERLEPWVVRRARDEIGRRVLNVYFADPAPQNWELKTNNWPAVCASCIGGSALWLVRDPEKLAGMLWRTLAALRQHLQGFDEQGATPEGAAYWQFGFGYYVYFAELLYSRTAGQVDLLAGEKLRRIACFPRSCMLTGSQVINFSDAPAEIDYQPGLYDRLRRRFPEAASPEQAPVYKGAFRSWMMASRMLLWMEPEAPAPGRYGGLPRREDYYFPGHGWVVSKSADAGGLVAFAAKGGSNDEPHNHNDLGHFIVHVRGRSVLCDLGAGEYTRQYFQPAYRYEQLTAGSYGHSVPVAAGAGQTAGASHRARPLGYERTDERVVYRLDLTGAYPDAALERLHREFVWERPAQAGGEARYSLTVRDECVFGKAESFESAFICSLPPALEGAGCAAIGPVTMIYDAERFVCRVTEERYRTIAGEERTAYRLVLAASEPSVRTVCEVRFEINGRG